MAAPYMRFVHPSTAIFSFVACRRQGFNSATGRAWMRGANGAEHDNPHPDHRPRLRATGGLRGGPGDRVRVLFGATWLTQEGEPGDAVLRAGSELPLSGGRTLVEALEPARLQVLGEPATRRLPSAGAASAALGAAPAVRSGKARAGGLKRGGAGPVASPQTAELQRFLSALHGRARPRFLRWLNEPVCTSSSIVADGAHCERPRLEQQHEPEASSAGILQRPG